jgi:hypothetical protein
VIVTIFLCEAAMEYVRPPAGAGTMTGVPASTHERARQRTALIIEREYQPDPERCVRATLALLSRRPPDTPSSDSETATVAAATASRAEVR